MFCNNCGNQIDDEEIFCNKCGMKKGEVITDDTITISKENEPKKDGMLKKGFNFIKEKNNERQEKNKLAAIEAAKWSKVSYNLYISDFYKQIKVNGKRYNYEDVLGAEIIEDGSSIEKTISASSSQNKTVAGGILFPMGIGIGGKKGTTNAKGQSIKSNTNICTNLNVNIFINSVQNPIAEIKLLQSNVDKNTPLYKNARLNAQKAIASINIIVRDNENTEKIEEVPLPSPSIVTSNFCENCGAKVNAESKFCKACGTKII